MQEDIVRLCEDCGSDCEGRLCLVCEESQCRNPHQQRLEAAIRKHRDYRGDHRCYQDDAELYAVLPEGDTRPAREVAVTLENCQRYIECRQQGRDYISPQTRIEELEALVQSLADRVAAQSELLSRKAER